MRVSAALWVGLVASLPRVARADPPAAPIQEATVRGRASPREPWRRDLDAADLQRMAGTRGDALLAVQNLPGVGRPPFGLGAFVLRGSDPEDSLVTLESQPIGLPFHLYGLATTLATDLIDRVEVLPGNFSARWGRAAGGVVNVVLRAPRRDRVRLVADVDVIDAGVFASVPLGRRAAVALGARRSYLDGLAALFTPAAQRQSFVRLPRYWDWQVALDADVSPRDAVRVVGSGSDDALVLNFAEPDPNDPSLYGEAGSVTRFHGVQGRWLHRFGPSTSHTLAPALGWNHALVSAGSAVRYDITTTTFALRDEVDARLGRHARITAGLDLQAGSTAVALRAPPLSTNGITDPVGATGTVALRDTWSFLNPAGFVEVALDPTARVRLLAGIRFDYFSRFDRATVDPRVSLTARLHPRLTLRAGLGTYSTPPRGYAVLRGFGNPDLTPERWLHAALGAVWEPVSGLLEASADVFVKQGDDVVSPSTRVVQEADGLRPLRYENRGDARVTGVELFARLRPGRWPVFAQLAYTWQRALRRDGVEAPWYPSAWDQPHLVTALAGVALPRRWELGLRVRATSGLPEPRVTGALYDSDHDVALTRATPWDPARLPATFALDLRAAKRFRWGPVAMQLVVEVLNATHYTNVESRVYAWDRRTSVPVTGMPIVPSLGLRGEY
jgi:hypothetical protein